MTRSAVRSRLAPPTTAGGVELLRQPTKQLRAARSAKKTESTAHQVQAKRSACWPPRPRNPPAPHQTTRRQARANRDRPRSGAILKAGHHGAGTKRGDANALRSQFAAQGFGERQHERLAGVIDRHAGTWQKRRNRTDVEIPPLRRTMPPENRRHKSVSVRTLRSIIQSDRCDPDRSRRQTGRIRRC